jgi:futalosine hydrolase
MKILIVAATPFETAPLRARLGMQHAAEMSSFPNLELTLLHTGIGMVNTAYQLGRQLALHRPDMAIQYGIGGAFDAGPAMEEVVEIVTEIVPELGADSPTGYLDLAEMGFAHFTVGEQPYYNSVEQPRAGLVGFRHCRAVTVNRVSGTAAGIASLTEQWQPEVESMEGAAFFQACLLADVPFRQLRAISNRVEPRDRSKWRMQEAIAALNQTLWDLLSQASIDISIL